MARPNVSNGYKSSRIKSRPVTTSIQASSGLSSNLQREGTFNSEERVLPSEVIYVTGSGCGSACVHGEPLHQVRATHLAIR